MEFDPQLCFQVMNLLEDDVGGLIVTAPVPPAFDNSLIVIMDSEVLNVGVGLCDCEGEEFEFNCLSPADVPAICLPALNQDPSPPSVSNDNPNAGG